VNGQRPVVGTGEVITVPAITLDDFLAVGGPSPQLVKIDVEGGEYEVLRGGTNLFQNQRPLIIAEVHHDQAATQIGIWLKRYRCCRTVEDPKREFPALPLCLANRI
jgi:Methyltransferase FkbM domain